MPRKRITGDGTEYTERERIRLADELDRAFSNYGPGTPDGVQVQAQIEWSGTIDANRRGGIRTTFLDRLDLAEVRRLADEARRAASQPELRSYRARGWRAQLRELSAVQRGGQARERAGLAPSRTTARRWERGTQTPSRANRERIAAAYDELRNPGRASADAKREQMADAFTAAVRDRYGVTVRFRDIQSWVWE